MSCTTQTSLLGRAQCTKRQPFLDGFGNRRKVLNAVAFGSVVDHDVKLARQDQYADPGKHSMDNCRRDGSEPTTISQHSRSQLQSTADQDGDAKDFQPVMLHQVKDNDRQAGCRTAHLQRSPGNPPDDKAADNARDQPRRNRYTGCNGNSHAKRQGHKEDDYRCEEILLRRRQQTPKTEQRCCLFPVLVSRFIFVFRK